ncbi:Intradiol ring-cleavage dioxygenase [Lineolata rhizophorae]|uniref:Intradiol ring-cleavage dioxygenase n=1 Tax=Lineolata rhizophorae TaxID=578093 RepID=A0A6A6NQL8_9PEZI|nr:Intradiol ring-cleavage dioxygenase [Lineolata rhizophorae]
MVQFIKLNTIAAAAATASLCGLAIAHPGEAHDAEKHARELATRNLYATKMSRDLEKCYSHPGYLAAQKRAVERRSAMVERLRQLRGIDVTSKPLARRDEDEWEEWIGVDHNKTGTASTDFDPSVVFASNATCVVTPEQTVGPYFVAGEMIRSNVTEGQAGVPLHLEFQFIDTSTCEPITVEHMVDIWHCNATGVYSGLDTMDQGGLDSTFARGVQRTDSDGTVQFDTIFPGHYTGRATHIHLTTHMGATELANGTYSGGVDDHIGQVYFDQDLRDLIETLEPYTANDMEVTQNEDDNIAPTGSSEDSDPIVEYTYLGASVEDGLLAWKVVGLDLTANYTDNATPAAYYREGGGVANPDANSGMPDGGGAPGGNGTMPGGPGANGTAPGNATASAGTGTSGTADVVVSTATSGAQRRFRLWW